MLSKNTVKNASLVNAQKLNLSLCLKATEQKYLLTLDDSCKEFCDSDAFNDFVTVGRRHQLSFARIKQNFSQEVKQVGTVSSETHTHW